MRGERAGGSETWGFTPNVPSSTSMQAVASQANNVCVRQRVYKETVRKMSDDGDKFLHQCGGKEEPPAGTIL